MKKLLVEIVVKSPAENIWNLTLLKHYTLKFPSKHLENRPLVARSHRLQQRNNFAYDEDSILNKRHDEVIKEVY